LKTSFSYRRSKKGEKEDIAHKKRGDRKYIMRCGGGAHFVYLRRSFGILVKEIEEEGSHLGSHVREGRL